MTRNQTASVSGFGAHTRTFVLSAAIGAVVALGVRSMFEDAAGNSHEAHAAPSAPEHHAAAGHEGHAHGDEQSAPDEHEGHQKHRGETKKDGEEPPKKKADAGDSAPAPKPQGVLLALGNANCPVMGDEVDGETFSEWRGLRVGHCCPRCGKRFLENPESLLDEVSPGWRDALAAAQAIDAASGKERDALLTAAAKKWKVLRRPAALVKKKQAGLLVDVGNANCPVMGGEVDGETFSEWKGLRVGHCCPGCGKQPFSAWV